VVYDNAIILEAIVISYMKAVSTAKTGHDK